MTAIAGVVQWGGKPDEAGFKAMLAALRVYGPHGEDWQALGQSLFARALWELVPEDRFDRQPIVHGDGASIFVGDARLDNRSDIADLLGLGEAAGYSDAELLARGYWRFGDELLNQLVGDFAFAVWREDAATLTLVRDPTGQRPLHYRTVEETVAFSSMPEALFEIDFRSPEVCKEALARFAADLPRQGPASFYEGVFRVLPGEKVTLRAGAPAHRMLYWQMPSGTIRYRSDEDYVDALRELLERATRARLRTARPAVGAHLSAGLDSSGVAATAAMISEQDKLPVFTAAPRLGFVGTGLPLRINDESGIAAQVAARHANMDHVVVRNGCTSPLDKLGRDAGLFQEPAGHPCNIVWWSAVNEAARERGVTVMLTGESGNLTLSAGGIAVLPEFLRSGSWLRWLAEVRALTGSGPRFRGVLATSFGPWLPRRVWRTLQRHWGGGNASAAEDLLQPAVRERLLATGAFDSARDGRPAGDEPRARFELLQEHEPGNFRKGMLARWGVDERDVTADRRLAEFCLRLPPEQLLRNGTTRWLARRALSDRLPESLLTGQRGYQYPDWYERIDANRLQRVLDGFDAPPASDILDFVALRRLAASWPSADWNSLPNIGRYRLQMLSALSAASFASSVRCAGHHERGNEVAAACPGR
jgi:asparagine synthase (glutamine-hydrolysing)